MNPAMISSIPRTSSQESKPSATGWIKSDASYRACVGSSAATTAALAIT
jgi:hypothetical protein